MNEQIEPFGRNGAGVGAVEDAFVEAVSRMRPAARAPHPALPGRHADGTFGRQNLLAVADGVRSEQRYELQAAARAEIRARVLAEEDAIRRALLETEDNVSLAAKRLGVSRQHLHTRLKRLGIRDGA